MGKTILYFFRNFLTKHYSALEAVLLGSDYGYKDLWMDGRTEWFLETAAPTD